MVLVGYLYGGEEPVILEKVYWTCVLNSVGDDGFARGEKSFHHRGFACDERRYDKNGL